MEGKQEANTVHKKIRAKIETKLSFMKIENI